MKARYNDGHVAYEVKYGCMFKKYLESIASTANARVGENCMMNMPYCFVNSIVLY